MWIKKAQDVYLYFEITDLDLFLLWMHMWNFTRQSSSLNQISIPSKQKLKESSWECLKVILKHINLFTGYQIIVMLRFSSVQFSAQSRPTFCNPMNCSTPGLPVHHHLPEFTQTHIHRVGDAIQPSHPLSSPSPPAPNPSQHQSLFQWVNSSQEVAKVLEFQL